jgi:hypothetical protein
MDRELPDIFHYAYEGRLGDSHGVTAVTDEAGIVQTAPLAVEAAILPYFEALYNGRHSTAPDHPEPFDSDIPFQPDVEKIPSFLDNLSALSPALQILLTK